MAILYVLNVVPVNDSKNIVLRHLIGLCLRILGRFFERSVIEKIEALHFLCDEKCKGKGVKKKDGKYITNNKKFFISVYLH